MAEPSGEDVRTLESRREEGSFLAGIYARLSVDGKDGKRESIDNQIAAAKKYISGLADVTLADIYYDLGATGTNFERRDFKRLMQDIRCGKVNCVVVRDFSRFGRNYIETGEYLEKIFPVMGVRFISVADQYDSLCGGDGSECLSIRLKHIINELYAKEIADRVGSAKLIRLKNGSYVGGIPPYGYKIYKNGEDRCLRPEEGTKEVASMIYGFYAGGMGIRQIVKELYGRGILRPSEYRKTGHVLYQKKGELNQWSESTIRGLLSNPVYTGTLVQKDAKGAEPVVFREAHEALISGELFCRVKKRLEEQKKEPIPGKKREKERDGFSGILYCGECGRRLKRICSAGGGKNCQQEKRYAYGCPGIGRLDGKRCGSHYISEEKVNEILLKALGGEAADDGPGENAGAEWGKLAGEKRKGLLKRQRGLERQIHRIDVQMSSGYMKYRSQKAAKEVFLSWKQDLEAQRASLERKLERIWEEVKQTDAKTERREPMPQKRIPFRDRTVLDGELIRLLTARIEIYADKHVMVQFQFRKRGEEWKQR